MTFLKIKIGQYLTHTSYDIDYYNPILANQIMSPNKFLASIETQLGLSLPGTPPFLRVQKWMEFVDKKKSGSFYEKSFEIDPIGTSQNLLLLRDELMSCGWDSQPINNQKKIEDISKINKEFSDESGLPERINSVCSALSAIDKIIIPEIEVSNDPIFLLMIWKKLFKSLEQNGTKITYFKPHFVDSVEKNLQIIKSSFKSTNVDLPNVDDSVAIIKSPNSREGANLLAKYLATKTQDDLRKILIIAPSRYRTTLAEAFEKLGIPFSGDSSKKSLSRPSIQILLITLGLVWHPKDPKIALALLQIPFNPFPKWIANKLARALEQLPAVGSEDWEKAITKIVTYLEDQKTDPEKIKNQLSDIDSWFGKNHSANIDDVEISSLISICDLVGEWARKRSAKQSSLLQTANNCRDLKAFLHNWSTARINKEILRKIIRETLDQGAMFLEFEPHGFGPIIVESPDEVMAPADEVIWWDATASSVPTISRSNWTYIEREALNKSGVEIINPQKKSELLAEKWQSPIGYAVKKIIFVTFDKEDNGNKDYFHPVFNQILNPSDTEIWITALTIHPGEIKNRITENFMKLIGLHFSVDKPPFKVSSLKDWNLPNSSIPIRKIESASSLEVLLGCTLSYALRYHSDLKGSFIPSISDLYKLIGSLSHSVLENVFKKGHPPDEKEAKAKVILYLEQLIPKMLPELLQPKNSLILKDVESHLINSAIIYTKFLSENGLEIYEAEENKSKNLLPGLDLFGQADQVLQKNGKIVSIIDFKSKLWKLFDEKLSKGTAIQPAIYSWFYKKDTWPDMGYFGINNAKILVAGNFTKNAEVVKDAVPPAEVIKNLITEIKDRKSVLKLGTLKANGLENEDDQGNFDPPCRFCDFDGICGMRWK